MVSIFQALKSFDNNKIYINFKCFRANIFAFVDSGSDISIIQKEFIQRIYPENTLHIPHRDMNINHYVSILYCNDADGDTIIYNETCKQENYTIQKKISPVKNRLVFFDGSYYHTGHSPSKNNYRIL